MNIDITIQPVPWDVPGFEGVNVAVRPLSVAEFHHIARLEAEGNASAGLAKIQAIRYAVTTVRGVAAGDTPIADGAVLADVLAKAFATNDVLRLVNAIYGRIMERSILGDDDRKNFGSSPPSD